MNFRKSCRSIALLSIGSMLFSLARGNVRHAGAQSSRFHLEEATIADVHRAIRAKQITATQLVQLYFNRIEAYNGVCVKGDVDATTGLMLGDVTPIENAGQLNAYMTLNIRGRRSRTDTADNDPKMPDALEVAKAQDAYFARTGRLIGPLHGIPFAIKDNYDTIDMRTTAGAAAAYANDKPPQDATMIAKLRAAGAIFLGKTNLDEYAPASIARSALGGQTCNPYDTKRVPAGSSAGSAAAVAANLAMCALGTDTSGSVRFPSAANALVGMVATQGLVSRAGIIPLSFSRDRGGPICRTVQDTAAVLEVVSGTDPRDHVTAPAHGKKPVPYRNYAGKKSLAGKRLGVVREFMIEATLADRDSIRIANQAITDMKRLGATVIDPVNFDRAIAEIMASYEPSFFSQTFKEGVPAGSDPIDRMVAITTDSDALPTGVRGVNLRMIAGQRRGEEGKYAMNVYLRQRGDAKFRSVDDLLATRTFSGDLPVLQNTFGAKAKTLDTPAHSSHILRMQNLQRILYKVMADNNLDALVYPYSTVLPHIVLANRTPEVYDTHTEPRMLKAGTELSDPSLLPGETTLKTDLDLWRGAGGSWSVNLSPVSGFPAIVVPAGFTREVYDRVPDSNNPNGSRLEGPKHDQIPVGMEFLARPFAEAILFEIASAYEAGTKHRRAPKAFGPLKTEP